MDRFTINILPENFMPLPVIFNTASPHFKQDTIEYYAGKQNFYQILIVVDGNGTLHCNGEVYKLKKGCAFFTAKNVVSKYTNDGGLITAFLTVTGDGMPQILEHFGCGDFEFFESVNTEKYIYRIKEITDEYYKTKNEGVLSALSYSFFIDFLGTQQETPLASLDKTALYIEKNFTKKLSLEELAQINETSVSKLCHDFKDKYGSTIFQQILNLRLTYAHNLFMTNSSIKTKDAASLCGFDDVSYFCRAYKKKFGTSPSKSNWLYCLIIV